MRYIHQMNCSMNLTMKVNFSKDSKEFILNTQNYISLDNPTVAKQYITKLIKRIDRILQFPNIGKINTTFDDKLIREITLDGIKIIYKIGPKSITVLMAYRYIDFNESTLND